MYEIASVEDRLEELVQAVAASTNSNAAELLASLKPRADADDFAGIIRELLENYQPAFSSGSDDGETSWFDC